MGTSQANSVSRRWARRLLAGSAAALMLGASAASAAVLVVRSAGPSAKTYPPGRSLPDNARIQLQPGDVLIVLGPDSSRTLRGPGTFTLGATAAKPAGGVQMAAMARRGRLSALRAGDLAPRTPSIWHVDVAQSGKVCMPETGKVTLWRADAADALTLNFAAPDGSSQTAEWSAGEATLDWPQQLPVASGAEYQLTWEGAEQPSRLSFVTLPAEPADVAATAQTLIEKGCKHQLDTLLERVPAEPAAAAE